MFKKIVSTIILLFMTSSASPMLLKKSEIFVRNNASSISIVHQDGNFIIVRDGSKIEVPRYNVDKQLRNLSNYELARLLGRHIYVNTEGVMFEFVQITEEEFSELPIREGTTIEFDESIVRDSFNQSPGGYIEVVRSGDGEYSLRYCGRLVGGGLFGAAAGAWAGKFIASVVCHGTIAIIGGVVSIVGTPVAGYAVVMGLEGTFGSMIESTTTAAALACGIAGAVATGPV